MERLIADLYVWRLTNSGLLSESIGIHYDKLLPDYVEGIGILAYAEYKGICKCIET